MTSLQLGHDGNPAVQRVLADRSINPSSQDVQRLFRSWRRSTVGDANGDTMFTRLNDEVNRYNRFTAAKPTCNSMLLALQINKTDFLTGKGILTASQKKLNSKLKVYLSLLLSHLLWQERIQQAGEMVFCDATASLDRLNTPLFIISAATASGALPLAVVMTSGEDVSTMKQAFGILKTVYHLMHSLGEDHRWDPWPS